MSEEKSSQLPRRQTVYVLTGALALGVAAFAVGRMGGDKPASGPAQPLAVGRVAIPEGTTFRTGAAIPKVTFVEVADFQCAFCAKAAPALAAIEEKYRDDVVFVYLPVAARAHPRALPAAIAAMAAGRQGKFWAYRDRVFANQSGLADAGCLERHARELGLNVGRWKKDVADPTLAQQMQSNLTLAKQDLGVTGTPTFFINGRRLAGSQTAEAFAGIIDSQLSRAGALMAKGNPRAEVSARLTAEEQATAAAEAAKPGAPGAGMATPPARVAVALGTSPVKGAPSAPVTIVTFSEFQCPFCASTHRDLQRIPSRSSGGACASPSRTCRWPAHTPRRRWRPRSRPGRLRSRGTWQYHDKLFDNQKGSGPALEKYVAEVGLDLKRFRAALTARSLRIASRWTSRQAAALGVDGTPTIFVNGRRFAGAVAYDALKQVVEEELKKSKS